MGLDKLNLETPFPSLEWVNHKPRYGECPPKLRYVIFYWIDIWVVKDLYTKEYVAAQKDKVVLENWCKSKGFNYIYY